MVSTQDAQVRALLQPGVCKVLTFTQNQGTSKVSPGGEPNFIQTFGDIKSII